LGHAASSVTQGTITMDGNILLQCNNLNLITLQSTALTEMYAGLGFKVRYSSAAGIKLKSLITGSIDTKVLGNVQMTARGFGGALFIGAYINNSPTSVSEGDIDLSLII
jgi:hypothetical protein